MFYGVIHESIGNVDFEENIKGTNYKFYINDKEAVAKQISKLKSAIIARAKAILNKEEYIKKQVYALYKNTTKEQFEKDKIELFEVIDPYHDEFKKDKFELGIMFTSVNQFSTIVDKRFKIYEDDTYVY